MLRLVHPRPEGQGTDPPTRRKNAKALPLLLTGDEARRVRAALKNTARAYGGLDVLAAVIGVSFNMLHSVLYSRKHRPSGTFAIRLAKAAGMHVETLLSGVLNMAGRCPHCGSRVGDRPALTAGGAP